MKKILFAIAFVMMMVLGANAQSDGFFKLSGNDGYINRESYNDLGVAEHGFGNHVDGTGAPLGSGLIILTAFGAGYIAAKRKK